MTNSELIDILSAADFETIGEFEANNYDFVKRMEIDISLHLFDVMLIVDSIASKNKVLESLCKYSLDSDIALGVLDKQFLNKWRTLIGGLGVVYYEGR